MTCVSIWLRLVLVAAFRGVASLDTEPLLRRQADISQKAAVSLKRVSSLIHSGGMTQGTDDRDGKGCCFAFGFGEMMKPCCLTAEKDKAKADCPAADPSKVGGSGGWSPKCPATAAEANGMVAKQKQDKHGSLKEVDSSAGGDDGDDDGDDDDNDANGNADGNDNADDDDDGDADGDGNADSDANTPSANTQHGRAPTGWAATTTTLPELVVDQPEPHVNEPHGARPSAAPGKVGHEDEESIIICSGVQGCDLSSHDLAEKKKHEK